MNTSDLNDTLNGSVSGKILAAKISIEVESYSSLMKLKGSTIPLNFNEDKDIFLDKSSVKRLLTETQNGNLSNVHLAYICDCLTLGENVIFENEVLKDIIFEIADPEINFGFKKPDEILRLLEKISQL